MLPQHVDHLSVREAGKESTRRCLTEKSERGGRIGQSRRMAPENCRSVAIAHRRTEAVDQLSQFLTAADGNLDEAHLAKAAKVAALFAELRRPCAPGARCRGGAVNAILRR